jgi:multidrug efflux pump subunit AcrB
MNLSAPFIRRPIATALLMVSIVLLGAIGYELLPVAALPSVDSPTIQVTAQLPGADPRTVASSVATPLERQFGQIPGLAQMTSSSALGYAQITLQFGRGRTVDSVAQDVQAAINATAGELPPNLLNPPVYRKTNPADTPILLIALTSGTLPLTKVSDYANSILAQKLSQMPGVGLVTERRIRRSEFRSTRRSLPRRASTLRRCVPLSQTAPSTSRKALFMAASMPSRC